MLGILNLCPVETWVYCSDVLIPKWICVTLTKHSLDSNTVADPASSWPVVSVRRRPELQSDVDSTPRSLVQLSIQHAWWVESHIDDVTDILLQRQRQRQNVDASSARIHQVACDYSSTTILQAAETAHASDQRHLCLRRCIRRHTAP